MCKFKWAVNHQKFHFQRQHDDQQVDDSSPQLLGVAYLQLFVLAKVIAPQKKMETLHFQKIVPKWPFASLLLLSGLFLRGVFGVCWGKKKTPSSMKEVLWVMSFAPSLEHSGPMAWNGLGAQVVEILGCITCSRCAGVPCSTSNNEF